MSLFRMLYWILAYSAGAASLSVILISWIKRVESVDRLLFHLSFFSLIVVMTIMEFLTVAGMRDPIYLGYWTDLSCLGIAVTLPRYIHSRKSYRFSRMIDAIGIWILFSFAPLLIFAITYKAKAIISYPVIVFLIISLIYSLGIDHFIKSKALPESLKKPEKYGSVISLIFLPLIIGIDILHEEIPILTRHIPQGIYSIPAFFTILSLWSVYEIIRLMSYKENVKTSRVFLEQYQLSQREKEVLEYLVSGISYSEIATKLFISHSTVKTHISNIYRKTGVSNKVELINKLREY